VQPARENIPVKVLKNFSLITRENKIELTPAYDILNSSIALVHPQEEIALPVMGKKQQLNRSILVDYFGGQRLGINDTVIHRVLGEIESALPAWFELIDRSFLTPEMKDKYKTLLQSRIRILF
jgi:serine/threonine-protein kinase HipA